MIEVRLYANLAFAGAGVRPPRGAASAALEVEARPGLTVRQVLEEAGIRPQEVFAILINGVNAGLDSPLADGDRLGLFPPISGG